MSADNAAKGEKQVALSRADERLISEVAFPKLDETDDGETLKHFADVWWNLCLWEKQRADAIDAKANALLGLASVASAVVAATGLSAAGRFWAVILFLGAAGAAVWTLFVRDYGGFLDQDVFDALTAGKVPLGTPPFTDRDAFRSYLRELVMQRALVYAGFKRASESRSLPLRVGQFLALAAIAWLAFILWQAHGG